MLSDWIFVPIHNQIFLLLSLYLLHMWVDQKIVYPTYNSEKFESLQVN